MIFHHVLNFWWKCDLLFINYTVGCVESISYLYRSWERKIICHVYSGKISLAMPRIWNYSKKWSTYSLQLSYLSKLHFLRMIKWGFLIWLLQDYLIHFHVMQLNATLKFQDRVFRHCMCTVCVSIAFVPLSLCSFSGHQDIAWGFKGIVFFMMDTSEICALLVHCSIFF